MKILYIGFKGIHNSSYKLVNKLQGKKVFLTNSFDGLKKDIENIDEEYDIVYMFGLDKTLKESVRIEKCAEKDGELLYTNIELEDISEKFSFYGVEYSISDRPTHYLCNEAYFYMLAKMKGKAVFIHIPSLKNMTDEFFAKITKVIECSFGENMNVIKHYDNLINENNDSFNDPLPLQEYMNKWDGQLFVDSMCLTKEKSVLEVGVGTGRIAARVIPCCGKFVGIDISPKTIIRAKENLSNFENIELICADFMNYEFSEKFDVIYSSLTSMHFEDKQAFVSKIASLLREEGRFCLSIDKNQSEFIDMGNYKLKIYPDSPNEIISCIEGTDMYIKGQFETKFAYIFVCSK